MQNALAGEAQGVSGNRNQQGERVHQHPFQSPEGEASLLFFAGPLKDQGGAYTRLIMPFAYSGFSFGSGAFSI